MKKYFIDTSIWLNLFNMEGDSTKGVPYWKLAQAFIENTLFNNDSIYYSGSVLRELQLKLVDLQYARNDYAFQRGTFRLRGNNIDLLPSYLNIGIKIETSDDKIISIY